MLARPITVIILHYLKILNHCYIPETNIMCVNYTSIKINLKTSSKYYLYPCFINEKTMISWPVNNEAKIYNHISLSLNP